MSSELVGFITVPAAAAFRGNEFTGDDFGLGAFLARKDFLPHIPAGFAHLEKTLVDRCY